MFDTELIPCYLDSVSHRVEKVKGEEVKMTDLSMRIQPFPVKLANELDEQVRGILFSRTDAEPSSKIWKIHFKLPIKAQQVVFRSAPDLPNASFTITETKVLGVYARKSKKTDGWTLVFKLAIPMPSKDELALIVDGLYKQHFLTFANAAPGLFDDEERAERRRRRSSGGAAGESATAH